MTNEPERDEYRFHRCIDSTVDRRESDSLVRGYEDLIHEPGVTGNYRKFVSAKLDYWKDRQKLACRQVEKYCDAPREDHQETDGESDPDSGRAAQD